MNYNYSARFTNIHIHPLCWLQPFTFTSGLPAQQRSTEDVRRGNVSPSSLERGGHVQRRTRGVDMARPCFCLLRFRIEVMKCYECTCIYIYIYSYTYVFTMCILLLYIYTHSKRHSMIYVHINTYIYIQLYIYIYHHRWGEEGERERERETERNGYYIVGVQVW